MMIRYVSVLLLVIVLGFTGCRNNSKASDDQNGKLKFEQPQFAEDPTSDDLRQKTTLVLAKIDSNLSEFDKQALTLPGNELVPDAPVVVWSVDEGKPMRIDQSITDDAGNVRATLKYYFIDGRLFYSDQVSARYIFDEESLQFWTDEDWNVHSGEDFDYDLRNQHIQQTVSRIVDLIK